MGLRDRSRVKRRAAIERTALQLFAEHGYEATTIAQIADVAEVSPRTVSLYFPSKLDLALSYLDDSASRFNVAIAERQDAETTLDVFRRWIEDEIRTNGDLRALHHAMVRANPTLRGAQSIQVIAGRRATVVSLAADLGRSPDDVVVQLVGGAMDGVLAALAEIRTDDVDPLEALALAIPMLRALTDTARVGSAAPKAGAGARRRSGKKKR